MSTGKQKKVAIVLCAAGGLGSAIARALARDGFRVIASDVHAHGLAETVSAIRSEGGVAHAVPANLADLDQVDHIVNETTTVFGAADVLINLSGGPSPGPIVAFSAEEWLTQFRTMVLPIVHLTARVLPNMRMQRYGRIITSTSSGVIVPISDLGLSNALRSTLVGWSKSLASEVASDGVTVNVVVPGRIATTRIEQLDLARAARAGQSVEAVKGTSVQAIPMARYGEPWEYAEVVSFLASERASYVTGSMVRVDGGLIPSV